MLEKMAGRGVPKEGKKGKKGKGVKVPPRQLYYGPEEKDARGNVPIQLISRRVRTAQDSRMTGFYGFSDAPTHRPAPVFKTHRAAPVLDTISLIDVADVQVVIPPVQTAAEREDSFRSHWAFRPAPVHEPLRSAADDMRPFIERMLASIARKEMLRREEEAAAAAAAKAAKKGGKKKK